MDADAVVTLLQEKAQLFVLQVRLKANVVVGGVGHFIATHTLAQHVPMVACGTAGAVLIGAGGTGGALTYHTGDHALAWRVLIWARAAPGLLKVGANVVILTAVHYREDIIQPVAERPATDRKVCQSL